MARLDSIQQWVDENQGKHFCHCGCGQAIHINRNHRSNGIREYIKGHANRTRQPKNGYLPVSERSKWVEEHQGKHQCNCGCQQVIPITIDHFHNGIPQYMHGHNGVLRQYPSETERFWSKVDKRGENECWPWLGSKSSHPTHQYGCIRSKDKAVKNSAHRLSYKIAYGVIPEDKDVLHRCDNPSCVNPHHLFLGTHADNMLDAAKKGRLSKLTMENVKEIVILVRDGNSLSSVARKFKISPGAIYHIVNGQTWSHVTGIGGANSGQ